MDELIKSRKLQFERSDLFIQIYKKDTGIEYVKIIQNINNDKKNSVFINPDNLDAIIDTLIHYKEDISKNQKIDSNYFINENDKKSIINNFLKGSLIKDLCLQYGYQDFKIRELLTQNNIEIIEGISLNNPSFKFKYKKKI